MTLGRSRGFLDLTVLVCCSDDFDLHPALDSIDDDVRVVASITPNPMIQEFLERRSIPFAVSAIGNHAEVANAGLRLVTTPAVLIIDSDTTLKAGAIEAVRHCLRTSSVVNVPIEFAATESKISGLIARVRDFDNRYDNPAYKPGIAFRMSVCERVGGYWYDSRVAWPCDAELLSRLRQHRVDIAHLDRPGLVHRPNTLKHVVRAYYNYGIGDAQRMALLDQDTHWRPLKNLVTRYRACVADREFSPAMFGLLALLDACSLLGIARGLVDVKRPARA